MKASKCRSLICKDAKRRQQKTSTGGKEEPCQLMLTSWQSRQVKKQETTSVSVILYTVRKADTPIGQ